MNKPKSEMVKLCLSMTTARLDYQDGRYSAGIEMLSLSSSQVSEFKFFLTQDLRIIVSWILMLPGNSKAKIRIPATKNRGNQFSLGPHSQKSAINAIALRCL